MGFKCGIVGLPNVGKSTIFNALTHTQNAQAANFPFCTIEPNVGIVAVHDERVQKLAELVEPKETIFASMRFVDIAGLVKGASKGEGLGNAFLSNIREVDAIAHVVRCFDDDDVVHVEGGVDPQRDIETIEAELILKDLDSLEKASAKEEKLARSGEKSARTRLALYQEWHKILDEGKPLRLHLPEEEEAIKILKDLCLLTTKPLMYVANVAEDGLGKENPYLDTVKAIAQEQNVQLVTISGKLEAEIAQLEEEEQRAFLDELGMTEPSLNRMIQAGYSLLGLITYFTAGPKEVRAWTVRKGSSAPQAAGVIHSDFERGFIRAETISYQDYIEHNGQNGAKEAGKLRLEGKDYIVVDGDIMHFRFSV